MVWTHNERYMLSVDDGGRVKYWRTNYELLKDEAAHQDAVCGVTVAPSDAKFATCSKDGTLKVQDTLLQPCSAACLAVRWRTPVSSPLVRRLVCRCGTLPPARRSGS